MKGIDALVRWDMRAGFLALCPPPWEETIVQSLSCVRSLWADGHQQTRTRDLPAARSWTSQPPEPSDINVCCLSHCVYGIMSQQPEQTKTSACFNQEKRALPSVYGIKHVCALLCVPLIFVSQKLFQISCLLVLPLPFSLPFFFFFFFFFVI